MLVPPLHMVPQEFRFLKDLSVADEPESPLLIGIEHLSVLRPTWSLDFHPWYSPIHHHFQLGLLHRMRRRIGTSLQSFQSVQSSPTHKCRNLFFDIHGVKERGIWGKTSQVVVTTLDTSSVPVWSPTMATLGYLD